MRAIIIHRPSLSEMAGWGLQQYLKHVSMSCLASSVLTCPKLKYPTLIPEKCVASLSFLPGSSFPQKKCSYVQHGKGGPEHPSQLWATTDEQLSSSRCAPPRGSTCPCSNSSGQSLSEGEWNLPSLQHRRILPDAFQSTAGLLHCGEKKKKSK